MTYSIDEKKVVYADLDPKEGVVLNLDTKNYYRLNQTGQVIWQGLSAGKNAEEIARSLENEFDISFDAALADAKTLIAQCLKERLLTDPAATTPAHSAQQARQDKKSAK